MISESMRVILYDNINFYFYKKGNDMKISAKLSGMKSSSFSGIGKIFDYFFP